MVIAARIQGLRNRVANLMVDDRVFKAVQLSLRTAHGTRKHVDRNILRLMAALNIPTKSDIRRMDIQIDLLQKDLRKAHEQLQTLKSQLRH